MLRIQEIRKSKGINQEDLAELMGTTAATISRLENGRRDMTMSWLNSFAAALQVSPAELIEEPKSDLPKGFHRKLIVGTANTGIYVDPNEDNSGEPEFAVAQLGEGTAVPHLFLLKMGDDSMDNASILPGDIVVCCPRDKYWGEIKDDSRLLVTTRDTSGAIQTVIRKLVVMDDGSHYLWPQSTNPKLQTPIEILSQEKWPARQQQCEPGQAFVDAVVVGRLFQTFDTDQTK